MLRHKAKKASLDVGYVSEWNDDHFYDFTDELEQSFSAFGSYYPLGLYAESGTGGDWIVEMIDNHSWIRIFTGTTPDTTIKVTIGELNHTNKLDLPSATFAMWINNTELAEFGFIEHDEVDLVADKRGAYFRVYGNNVYAVCGDGVDETEVLIGPVVEYSQYKIEFHSADVRFYTEDLRSIRATISTHIPTEDLQVRIAIKTTDTTDRDIKVDAFGYTRLRVK